MDEHGQPLRLGTGREDGSTAPQRAAGDILRVEGDADLRGTIIFDVDLGGTTGVDAASVASDSIVVEGGAVRGDVALQFEPLSDDRAIFGGAVALIDYDDGADYDLSFTALGLPTNTSVLYEVVNNTAASAVQLQAGANPAIGGLASGIALTQSLIGSVVNRPSSPFVTGAAAGAEDDPCGYGTWARATGGRADAEGETETSLGTFGSQIDASYRGLQVGGDYACSGGRFRGFDLTFGGILGVNDGSTEQPVYSFDANRGVLDTDVVTSVNKTDFTQTYGGVYVAAARDQLVADLQYRHELTQFDLENDVRIEGQGLGVDDQEYDSRANTISGSMSYAIPFGKGAGLNLVPTAGFSISRVSTDSLSFSNLPDDQVQSALGTDDGILEFEDYTSKIGFLGASVSKSRILPDGMRALTYFATGTVYRDFADGVTANYYRVDSEGEKVGDPLESRSSNLGTYGEISVGVNYTRLLEPGDIGPARQLNASVRVDTRFSDDIESVGLTAQARLQF